MTKEDLFRGTGRRNKGVRSSHISQTLCGRKKINVRTEPMKFKHWGAQWLNSIPWKKAGVITRPGVQE